MTARTASRTRTARPRGEAASPRRSVDVRLKLLGAFELVCDGATITLPMSAQRVIAFVALHEHPLQRAYVAGCLWLYTPEDRAHANLRSALWRIHRCGHRLVETAGPHLRLGSAVRVDLPEVEGLARRALAGGDADLDLEPSSLAGDLLPDWYDEWVLFERERFRQLRLRALDALCEKLTRAGRLGDALDAGLAAVAGEPLRESAHRAVVRVHLAEGNVNEAMRQYDLFRRLIREQLGVAPSASMEELIRGIDTADTAG